MLEKYAKQEAVMVVGHNPSITEFIARIITKSGSEALIEFKKGALRTGADADIVLLNEGLKIERVWTRGASVQ